jgi:hypothetical protein
MSESSSDIGIVRLIKAYPTELDIRADRDFVAMMPPANVSIRTYNATSKSGSQITWSEQTPSVRVGLVRSIDCEVKFKLKLNPIDEAGDPSNRVVPDNLYSVGGVGPRQMPLHSIMETLNVRLNDQSFVYEPSETIHALLAYGNDWYDRNYGFSATAHKPDSQWRYDNVPGASRDPFTTWIDSGLEDSRRMGFWAKKLSATEIEITVVEQLMISPLIWGESRQCLFGVQNLDVTMVLRQPLTRLLSGDLYGLATGGTPLATGHKYQPIITVEDAVLHLKYLQPQAYQTIPHSLNYEHNTISRFTKELSGGKAPLADFGSVTYNNIQLNSIPKRVYLYCAPKQSTNAEADSGYINDTTDVANAAASANDAVRQADFFATIDKLRVNFDSADGRFSTYTSYDLWKVAKENGYQRSWLEWSQYLGSVMCIDFGKDMGLNPLLCSGCRGSFQFNVEIDYKDIRNRLATSQFDSLVQTDPKEYRAHLVVVNSSILNVTNQLITVSTGPLTEQSIYDAPWAESGLRMDIKDYYGGGSFKNVWKAVKKVGKTVAPVAQAVSGVLADALSQSHPNAALAAKVAQSGLRTARGGSKVRCASLSRRM